MKRLSLISALTLSLILTWAPNVALAGEPPAPNNLLIIADDLPDDFYSTRYYTDRLLEWLERDKGRETPFFASYSVTAPHDPLHAPAE